MHSSCFGTYIRFCGLLGVLVLAQPGLLHAQRTSFGPSEASAVEPLRPVAAAVSFVSRPQESPREHRFWDNKNRALFATSAALGTVDFFFTRSNLQSGGRELNPVTRWFGTSTPGLALNFSLETGSIIGASYIFHKTGHHKLERITSLLNISGSAAAVSYSISHR